MYKLFPRNRLGFATPYARPLPNWPTLWLNAMEGHSQSGLSELLYQPLPPATRQSKCGVPNQRLLQICNPTIISFHQTASSGLTPRLD